MPLEQSIKNLRADGLFSRLPDYWRSPLTQLAIAWLALIALFANDWAAMAMQWWDSSTYNHILLIPAIVAVLIWQRADSLAKLVPQGWWPGLILLGGALFVWLLGAVSGLNLARQLGAVVSLQAVFLTLMGPRVAAACAFPLAYMLFLVPFGDELVPALQMITAELTIALTHMSGIPAEIEGVFIDTPAGLFEVAEACSGVKFLIAMVALGSLVAATCFKSWKRRIIFMSAAIILPIVANGIRAWGTIYIAQSQGVEFAAGFDHIFYGWVFFGLVMGLLLGVSWKWFDRSPEDSPVDLGAIENSQLLALGSSLSIGRGKALVIGGALIVAVSFWALVAGRLEAKIPDAVELPEVAGWSRTDYAPAVAWEPTAVGATHRLLGSYQNEAGRKVDVFIALYASQDEQREAGGFGQGALMPDTEWRWLEAGKRLGTAKTDYLLANGRVKRFAATWFRTGELLSGSNSSLKLATMRDKLLLSARPTTTLIISSEAKGEEDPAEAVSEFTTDVGSLGEWIDRIAQTD
ncbi:exosortase A [Altererythrobacter sp. ZODW24]|uniref:exosortase A n=1 Tax=Altererythrobacter sp. ZODW24 TaxID=2185142 RepID=UPI001F07860C|nr:exosortase A [Altererythrobacter sp. ZODW24]